MLSVSATSFPVIGFQSLTICSLMLFDVVSISVSYVTFDSASTGLWGGGSPAVLILGRDDGSDGNALDGEVVDSCGCPVGLKAKASHSVEAKSLPEIASRTIISGPSEPSLSISPFSPRRLWKASSFESGLKTGLDSLPYGALPYGN